MRRLIPTCLVALGLAAVPLSAQESTTKSTTTVKTDDAKVTTLTGCVAGGPSSFTLTKVAAANTSSEKPSDAPSPVGTSGIASSYTLSARGGVDLSEHVGKKVEVTGVAMPAAAKGDDDAKISVSERTEVKRDDAPDEKAESKSSAEVARGAAPTFAVVSVKMVAASCD
jgi:hypothetical protein